tara:strand:- start:8757 stop:9440 length:684 start_codon:yes stop_codon:yes gene_type:complete
MLRLFIIFFLSFSFQALGHQPKLIYNTPSYSNPYIIEDPEISKAFYGSLNGESHYFKIHSENQFLFYAGILSPKRNNEKNLWLSIDVIDQNGDMVFQANGSNFNWEAWYEPYARDWYWKGPEIGKDTDREFKTSFPLEGGTYFIKVFNDKNFGHYSLAVGELEFFGANFWEKVLTWTPILFYIGPYMDIVHWQKFDVRAYIPHIFLFILIFVIYLIQKRLFRKKFKL